MTYPRKNGKSEKSLIEFIEWADSLEETPVDYVEAARLSQNNLKEWCKSIQTAAQIALIHMGEEREG